MSNIKITECRCCGNRDAKQFIEKGDGYICKCCGVWFRYETEEERDGCLAGYRQLRKYKFEDARDTFEEVLVNYPGSIDARWGLLLSRFGVVYIKGFYDDVIEPVYCFPDYEVLSGRTFQNEDEYREMRELIGSDTELKYLYDAKAREIDRAIKKFRDCKESTERDVFICVKISASTEKEKRPVNERTKDYEFALKAYKDLQARGLNVFFSFVTLKNEVGSDDLIWLNLVKSKKMLLIGSREDYLESAWVKSEWKRWRFLERQKDMYICVLNDGGDNPKNILPYELRKDAPQIYTPDTYGKLLDDICGVEYKPAETFVPTNEPEKAAYIGQDGKIVYSDGREEVLKHGITKIKDGAYSEDEDIVSVVLPDSVVTIGDRAFFCCQNLVSVTMRNGVKTIMEGAFAVCSSLKTVKIPDSVKTMGEGVFYGCEELSSVTLSSALKDIPKETFGKCPNLTAINIPEGVTSIGEGTFTDCYKLADVSIPVSVTEIGASAFRCCYALKRISIPGNVVSVGNEAFSSCNHLIYASIGCEEIGKRAFSSCGKLAKVELSENVKKIRERAFAGCYSLEDQDFEIPSSVEVIEGNPFWGYKVNLIVSPQNRFYKMIDGNLYTANGKELVAHFTSENETPFSVPNTVVKIGEYAFSSMGAKSVIMPNTVKEFGCGAFMDKSDAVSTSLQISLAVDDIYFKGKKAEWERILVVYEKDRNVNERRTMTIGDIIKNTTRYSAPVVLPNVHFKTLFGYTK